MPIGKNAIKRVENNGYSKVKTAAPDMENSTVIANISKEVVEKMVKPVEEKTKAKAAAKAPAKTAKTPAKTAKAPAKPAEKAVKTEAKPVAKKPATKKPAAKKAAVKTEKNAFERVSVGNDMPYYLL